MEKNEKKWSTADVISVPFLVWLPQHLAQSIELLVLTCIQKHVIQSLSVSFYGKEMAAPILWLYLRVEDEVPVGGYYKLSCVRLLGLIGCVYVSLCVCVREIRERLTFTELVTKTSFAWETFHSDLTDHLTHLSPKCRLALFYNCLNVDGPSKCLNLHYFFFRSSKVIVTLPTSSSLPRTLSWPSNRQLGQPTHRSVASSSEQRRILLEGTSKKRMTDCIDNFEDCF